MCTPADIGSELTKKQDEQVLIWLCTLEFLSTLDTKLNRTELATAIAEHKKVLQGDDGIDVSNMLYRNWTTFNHFKEEDAHFVNDDTRLQILDLYIEKRTTILQ